MAFVRCYHARQVDLTALIFQACWRPLSYHSPMATKVTSSKKKRTFTTVTSPLSGVVGLVASDVPIAAIEGLLEKLLAGTTERMALDTATHICVLGSPVNRNLKEQSTR